MRLLLLTLLLPFFSYAQSDSIPSDGVMDSIKGTSMILKNYDVIFQKVYTSKLNIDELSEKVNSLLSAFKKFRIEDGGAYRNQNEFVGRLYRYRFDTQRYQGGMFSGALFAYDVTARVTVQVKDFRYRVIVSEITFKNVGANDKEKGKDLTLNEDVVYKKGTKIKATKSNLNVLQYISQDLSAAFDIQRGTGTDDF